MHVQGLGVYEKSLYLLPSPFCCKLKTALKNKVRKFKDRSPKIRIASGTYLSKY